jgi:predicted hydrocarbon binding protein
MSDRASSVSPQDFIRSRPAEGELHTPDNRRVVALPAAVLQALHAGLADGNPGTLRPILYRAGYEWGLQEMLHLHTRLRAELDPSDQRDLWHLDAPFVLERWAAPFAAAGWGACVFDVSEHGKRLLFVELRHSAAAAACRDAKINAPVCHLYAGLFAGALSFYDRTESHAVETECTALGHACCRFIVGPGPLIDQAENARQSGLAHEAIRRLGLDQKPAAPAGSAKAAKIPWKK